MRHRYSGTIIYTLSTPIKDVDNVKEIIELYNINEINELSYCELNQQLFIPTFTGKYEITDNGTKYKFTYYCFSTNNNLLDKFKEFMSTDFWSLNNTDVHDDLQERINDYYFTKQMINDNSNEYEIDFSHCYAKNDCYMDNINCKYKYEVEIQFTYNKKVTLEKDFDKLIDTLNSDCIEEWLYYLDTYDCFTSEYNAKYTFYNDYYTLTYYCYSDSGDNMDEFKQLFTGHETIEFATMVIGFDDYDDEFPHIKFSSLESELNKISFNKCLV